MDDAAALVLIERALAAGETLLWREAAPVGPPLAMAVGGAVFLAALIVVFVRLTGKALRRGGLSVRVLLGLTLALLVAGEIVSVQGIFAARSTVYAVTDARVLIVSRDPMFAARSYALADVLDLRRDGAQLSFRYGEAPHQNAVTLWELSDPDAVEQLIRERAPEA